MRFIEEQKVIATCVANRLFRQGLVVVAAFALTQASMVARPQEVPAQLPAEYLLVSANGQELPAVVSGSGARTQEVIGGSIRLEGDGSFLWSTRYRYTERGVVDVRESSGRGSYSQQGTRIFPKFEAGEGGCCEGTLDGETLTIRADVLMVYKTSSSP